MKQILFLLLLCLPTLGLGQATSRATYLKLMEVQEFWESQSYDQAIAELQSLAVRTQRSRNFRYDFLVANHYLAQTGILAERTPLARQALDTALATEGVEDYPELSADLKLLYGQILLSDEEYEKAHELLEQWYQENGQQGEGVQLFLLGYSNYMIEDYARAEMIIALALAQTTAPLDSWSQIYYQTLFEQQKYSQAEDYLLTRLNERTDSDIFWRLLTNHYLQLENGKLALSAMGMEYLISLLDSEADLKRLASLYSYAEIPEKGARLMEQWLRQERLQADFETLKRLGDLWLMARARDKAVAYLSRAAEQAFDGRTNELIGIIHFEDERWAEAYQEFFTALATGGLDQPERIQLLAGVSAMRAGMHHEARLSLESILKSKEYGEQAEGLLSQLE